MAYTAPAKATVVIVGGLGTQADKAELNGGGAAKAVWDAGVPGDFIDANGGPVRTAACAFTTATKNLNGTDIGNGVTVGTLCYVSVGDGAHVTAGIYEITTITDNDNIICANIDDDGTNDTNCTVNVGGALDTLQNTIDNPVNDGALHSRYIYDSIATETITSTIQLDTYGGTSSTQLYIIGYNATLTAEVEVTITTVTDLTGEAADSNSLIAFMNPDYISFYNIDFDGGGKDASRAVHCMYGAGTGLGENVVFLNCKFHGAESHGTNCRANKMSYIRCEFYLNGAAGIYTGAAQAGLQINSCSIHDNDASGLNMRVLGNGIFINNLVYDNGVHGIAHFGPTNNVSYIGNTVYGNDANGFNVLATDARILFMNNASVGNVGIGYDFNGIALGRLTYFGYNLSNVNGGKNSAHYSEGADGTFADYANGHNVASTQAPTDLFVSVTDGSEDFTAKTGSDLIDAALDPGTA